MSDPFSASKSARTVLRSIVSPAVGVSVGVLILAGAASAVGCGSTQSPDDGTSIGPVGSAGPASPDPGASGAPGPTDAPERVGLTSRPDPQPTAAPSGSTIPWVGEMAPPTTHPEEPVLTVGQVPPPRVGKVPATGSTPAPGFSASGFVHARSTARPTRATRRVTDADRTRLHARGALT